MKIFLVALSIMFGLMFAPVMAAQPVEPTTYIASDATFKVDYPPQWTFTADDEKGFYYLQGDTIAVTLYTPAVLDAYLIGNIADPAILAGLVLALNDVTEVSRDETLLDGRRAAIYRYQSDSAANTGLLAAVQFDDGTLGLVDAYTDEDIGLFVDDVLAVAASFDIPPVPAPDLLVRYAAPWQDAVGELVESEFIPAGGNLIFVQPSAFTAGTGVRFQGLAQQSAHQDVIVAGTLTYTASLNPVDESCAIVARFIDEANYLAVGQDATGAVFAADFVAGTAANTLTVERNLSSDGNYRFLFIAQGDRLVGYLDGQLVIEDMRITERAGSYGILLTSSGSAGCAVRDTWAYLLPEVAEAGTCQVVANGNVNQRSGPGVEFELTGQLASSATATAVSQTTGVDGLIWWQLADGSWVREDVVTTRGECASLPLTN